MGLFDSLLNLQEQDKWRLKNFWSLHEEPINLVLSKSDEDSTALTKQEFDILERALNEFKIEKKHNSHHHYKIRDLRYVLSKYLISAIENSDENSFFKLYSLLSLFDLDNDFNLRKISRIERARFGGSGALDKPIQQLFQKSRIHGMSITFDKFEDYVRKIEAIIRHSRMMRSILSFFDSDNLLKSSNIRVFRAVEIPIDWIYYTIAVVPENDMYKSPDNDWNEIAKCIGNEDFVLQSKIMNAKSFFSFIFNILKITLNDKSLLWTESGLTRDDATGFISELRFSSTDSRLHKGIQKQSIWKTKDGHFEGFESLIKEILAIETNNNIGNVNPGITLFKIKEQKSKLKLVRLDAITGDTQIELEFDHVESGTKFTLSVIRDQFMIWKVTKNVDQEYHEIMLNPGLKFEKGDIIKVLIFDEPAKTLIDIHQKTVSDHEITLFKKQKLQVISLLTKFGITLSNSEASKLLKYTDSLDTDDIIKSTLDQFSSNFGKFKLLERKNLLNYLSNFSEKIFAKLARQIGVQFSKSGNKRYLIDGDLIISPYAGKYNPTNLLTLATGSNRVKLDTGNSNERITDFDPYSAQEKWERFLSKPWFEDASNKGSYFKFEYLDVPFLVTFFFRNAGAHQDDIFRLFIAQRMDWYLSALDHLISAYFWVLYQCQSVHDLSSL